MQRVRWLGRVAYRDASALQRGLHRAGRGDWLLLLEHPPVYTTGLRPRPEHVLADPAEVGADLVNADRGGDVTYHGPGQLVGYVVRSVPVGPGATPAFVAGLEQVVIDAVTDLGVTGAGRRPGSPGVWVGDDKLCAVGVRLSRGRSMHGFALNVDPDLGMFSHIVPCGIRDREVTSVRRLLGHPMAMRTVVDAVVARFAEAFGHPIVERQDVVWQERAGDLAPFSRRQGVALPTRPVAGSVRLLGRLAEAGVAVAPPEAGNTFRRPEWMKVKARLGPEYRELKRMMRDLDLHTVCEEAGCPNIYECWADRTATFMILGDRCTRACGFCLVDTRRPLAVDADEPERLAEAVARMGLDHAVVTAVARDDLGDGGAAGFAACVAAVRRRCPATTVEVLIPDCKGDPEALATIFDARPDVVNHNLETVARLQRLARPSASYARSLAVLARAGAAGLVTKSGLVLGMGETEPEVLGALADLAGVGVAIVTLGQYQRPTTGHLPVARWWRPEEFD
ncbi:MAG: lipoyl(octanoyl) transferase LipB, partial [Acidimicrobiales bacterium]